VSPANIAGALFKVMKPDRKIIHRSMAGGLVYEDTEDYIKKQKKKQEVTSSYFNSVVLGDSWLESTFSRAIHATREFCKCSNPF
jgi:hypothetical protein